MDLEPKTLSLARPPNPLQPIAMTTLDYLLAAKELMTPVGESRPCDGMGSLERGHPSSSREHLEGGISAVHGKV